MKGTRDASPDCLIECAFSGKVRILETSVVGPLRFGLIDRIQPAADEPAVAQPTTTPFTGLVRATEPIGGMPPRHIPRLVSVTTALAVLPTNRPKGGSKLTDHSSDPKP